MAVFPQCNDPGVVVVFRRHPANPLKKRYVELAPYKMAYAPRPDGVNTAHSEGDSPGSEALNDRLYQRDVYGVRPETRLYQGGAKPGVSPASLSRKEFSHGTSEFGRSV